MALPKRAKRVVDLMKEGIALFKVKNEGYGEGYVVQSDILEQIVPAHLVQTPQQQVVYHHMYILIGKFLRISSILFKENKPGTEPLADSWRDIGVYAFMMQEFCENGHVHKYDRITHKCECGHSLAED